jgi:hypothetical protein
MKQHDVVEKYLKARADSASENTVILITIIVKP